MKEQLTPQVRIFVCINEKDPGKAACLKGEGEKCAAWLKEEVTKRGLKPKVGVTRTRCLGYCGQKGTAIVVEPAHIQLSDVKFEDIPGILDRALASASD